MSRTLVLLRHGRTPWNHEGRLQGQQDIGLDEVGHAQAARVAPVIAALSPSLLWCSDLGRTRETVSYVAQACGLPVVFDARLREFYFGEHERRSHTELAEIDPESYQALRRGDYERVRGAEPTADVAARMSSALQELLDALEPGQTAVAVSHGAAIRLAVGVVLGWPEGQFRSLRGLENCAWVVLREHPVTAVLQLDAYNRIA